jgi:hypothetical protein
MMNSLVPTAKAASESANIPIGIKSFPDKPLPL